MSTLNTTITKVDQLGKNTRGNLVVVAHTPHGRFTASTTTNAATDVLAHEGEPATLTLSRNHRILRAEPIGAPPIAPDYTPNYLRNAYTTEALARINKHAPDSARKHTARQWESARDHALRVPTYRALARRLDNLLNTII